MKKYRPNDPVYSKEEWLSRNDDKFWTSYYPVLEDKWLANFDILFPELVDFFTKLPLTSLGTTGYLYQNPKPCDVESSVVHTDEAKGLGIRVIFSEDPSGLFFHKIKKDVDPIEAKRNFLIIKDNCEYSQLDEYGVYKIVDKNFVINEQYLEKERIFVKPPHKNKQAFILTNDLAAHAVAKRNSPSITFAWFGKRNHTERFNWDQLDTLISTAKEKYPESVIYA